MVEKSGDLVGGFDVVFCVMMLLLLGDFWIFLGGNGWMTGSL